MEWYEDTQIGLPLTSITIPGIITPQLGPPNTDNDVTSAINPTAMTIQPVTTTIPSTSRAVP